MLQVELSKNREERWKHETEHFDAISYDLAPLPPETIER